jgi:acyl CoA:acetate/3-ketoacid CoA transferase alpha subunit
VKKIICSFPRQTDSHHFDACYRAGETELELVPQGNLAARIQAAGSGLTKQDFDDTVALHPSMAEELVLLK